MPANHNQPSFTLHSRIHPLRSYVPAREGRQVFVKRDDELSSGITGSKLRKYSSLLPVLLEGGYQEAVLLGGAQSNNIPGLLQLLNENGIPARLHLLRPHGDTSTGNLVWTGLLHDLSSVHWIDRADWPQAEEQARAYAADQAVLGRKVFVVPEGAACPEALPGAMSLADDFRRNEQETGIRFEHIFADAGTGTQAIGLLTGLAPGPAPYPAVHITLVAGTQEEFLKRYRQLQAALPGNVKEYPGPVHFYRSVISPSFGAAGGQILDEVRKLAREEGILADPVYTAKHFATARHTIEANELRGNILIIHSGGALGLAGFMERLAVKF